MVAFRENFAKLRSPADEKGYRIEKGRINGRWFLIDETTDESATSERGTTAFSVERAIKFFSNRQPSRRSESLGDEDAND
jgi:hypothetical protein